MNPLSEYKLKRLRDLADEATRDAALLRKKVMMLEHLIHDFDTYTEHTDCGCAMCDDLRRAARMIRDRRSDP